MKKTATWLAACMAAACALAPVIGCSSETEEPDPGIVYNADEWLITGTSVRLYRGKETDVTIPAGVTEIREHAFERCDAASVTIPGSVTVIGYSAFEGCKSLKSVTIPASVTSIGNGAFWDCTSLVSVTIPASVTEIGQEAFYECTSLTSVTISASVTSIGSRAFRDCTSLTTINYTGTEAQWNAITKGSSWDAFTGDYAITYNYTE